MRSECGGRKRRISKCADPKIGAHGKGGRGWDGNSLEFGRGEADGMGDEDGGEVV